VKAERLTGGALEAENRVAEALFVGWLMHPDVDMDLIEENFEDVIRIRKLALRCAHMFVTGKKLVPKKSTEPVA
jgi:hypothetical protein